MGNTYRLKSSVYGNNTTYFLSPIKICSFAAIFHFNVTEKDQRARKGNIGAATNGLEGPGGFTGWCLFHLSTSRWRGRKEKLMSNTGGGGGSVAKSCLTLATPWTVACQAPLSMGFSRQAYWCRLPELTSARTSLDYYKNQCFQDGTWAFQIQHLRSFCHLILPSLSFCAKHNNSDLPLGLLIPRSQVRKARLRDAK